MEPKKRIAEPARPKRPDVVAEALERTEMPAELRKIYLQQNAERKRAPLPVELIDGYEETVGGQHGRPTFWGRE